MFRGDVCSTQGETEAEWWKNEHVKLLKQRSSRAALEGAEQRTQFLDEERAPDSQGQQDTNSRLRARTDAVLSALQEKLASVFDEAISEVLGVYRTRHAVTSDSEEGDEDGEDDIGDSVDVNDWAAATSSSGALAASASASASASATGQRAAVEEDGERAQERETGQPPATQTHKRSRSTSTPTLFRRNRPTQCTQCMEELDLENVHYSLCDGCVCLCNTHGGDVDV